MNNFRNQIERIQLKLIEAKKIDTDLKAFGASSHRYIIGEKIRENKIRNFETKFNIQLPECYKTFLTQIGNGGNSYSDSAAGPFYGIYSLGGNVDELIDFPQEYLSKDVNIYPEMTDEYWENLIKRVEDDEEISDDEYDHEIGNIFSGILPIGSQGCTYLHGIILNGKNRGKVVNLDVSRHKPKFTYENHFLDWYERWLDEIISGELLADRPTWFGYTKGGSEEKLIQEYSTVTDKGKLPILYGIQNKQVISKTAYNFFEKEYIKESDEDVKRELLEILFKSDSYAARDYLIEFGKEELLKAFQFIFWYDKENSSAWLNFIEQNIERIDDDKTLTLCTYILHETKTDYGELLIRFTDNENYKMRETAFNSIGKLKNKSKYIQTFIKGLNDESSVVVSTTLQALENIKNPILLKHYKKLTDRYHREGEYNAIQVILNRRLADYDLSRKQLLNSSYEEKKKKKKWYEIWKK